MPTFTVFPNIKPSSGGKGNPYINDFISAINNEKGCKVINESHKNPLLSILRPSRWGDVFIFNWFESIPDFKYGYLQSLLAILLIFILKIKDDIHFENEFLENLLNLGKSFKDKEEKKL